MFHPEWFGTTGCRRGVSMGRLLARYRRGAGAGQEAYIPGRRMTRGSFVRRRVGATMGRRGTDREFLRVCARVLFACLRGRAAARAFRHPFQRPGGSVSETPASAAHQSAPSLEITWTSSAPAARFVPPRLLRCAPFGTEARPSRSVPPGFYEPRNRTVLAAARRVQSPPRARRCTES